MRTLASTWPFEDQQNAFHFPSCGVSTCTLPTDAAASPTPTDRSEKKAQRHRSSGSPSWSRWCAGPRPASGPTCDQRWGLKSEGPRSGNQQLKLVPNMLQPNIGPGRGLSQIQLNSNSTQFRILKLEMAVLSLSSKWKRPLWAIQRPRVRSTGVPMIIQIHTSSS